MTAMKRVVIVGASGMVGGHALRYALDGWEVSGVVVYNSGLPLTVTSSLGNDPGGLGSVNNASSTAGGRPDAIGVPQ